MNQDTNNTMEQVNKDDQHVVNVKAPVSFKLPDSLVELKSENTQNEVFENKLELMDHSLSCTNDTLKSMKESISSMEDTLKSIKEQFAKKHEFDMALACVHINSFSYKDTLNYDPTTSISSTELVKEIILWLQFCPGWSYNVSSDNYIGGDGDGYGDGDGDGDLNDNTRKAFRDALKKQLTTLFGHAPRFGEISAENNTFPVYYK